ncbi:MAG TPA: hypothetical protein VFG69_03050, partial [Nannocystaceae bacterium]|nr:hypothetical protein [Nannocystaceae bacterium]
PAALASGVTVLGEGVRTRGARLVLGQRRSICVVAHARDLASVRHKLYATAAGISAEGAHLRTDIGLARPLATRMATPQQEAT